MEKITSFITKNWVWIIVAILAIYLFYTMKKKKEAEVKAVTAFDKLNSMAAKAKQGAEYANEKKSLLNLIHNASVKERDILSDLLNGSIAIFSAAEQEQDKEKAKKEFTGKISKMQSDLVTKHGSKNVMSFKAKMDKYGFDI